MKNGTQLYRPVARSNTLTPFMFFVTLVILVCFVLLLLCLRIAVKRPRPSRDYFRRAPCSVTSGTGRKPTWVRKELIRLKAHLPEYGCREVAEMFNRIHTARGVTVSKSFVPAVLRAHAYEVTALRRTWKHRIPAAMPRNHTWGIDATGKRDVEGNIHVILGIVDHGSRKAVCLLPLHDLSTITILRVLLDTIERFGKPHFLRCDNASQFRSIAFRVCLKILGVRLCFSKPGMPWMNGRIERLFGTLKERLNHLAVAYFAALGFALSEFRAWYNYLRPHQHLGGRIPAEAWHGIDPFKRVTKTARYVVAWDGLLTGLTFGNN